MKQKEIVSFILATAALTIIACGGSGEGSSSSTGGGASQDFNLAQTRLQATIQAVTMYAGDNEGNLPLANTWMDAVESYTGTTEEPFRSPAVARPNYGFAMNSAIAGLNLSAFDRPATAAVFDSRVLTRNATAPTSTLPFPTRYEGGNVISYLDGSVRPSGGG